jgi:putative ABC transport system ATP-binding protein
MSTPLLRTQELCRFYRRGPQEIKAVDHVNFAVEEGEFVAIVGSSGSGKSTVLNLLAGLDTPTGGSIEFGGTPLSSLSRRQLAAHRAHQVGMVFQSFNLIHHRSAVENVEMALYFNQTPHKVRLARSTSMLERLGLADRMTHRPSDLSGGEQQRVAVARALVKEPKILFADEPTGNLDQENAGQISALLTELNREGLTIVMVTHDLETARNHAHRIIRMHYGRIVDDAASAGEGRS